MNENKGTRTLTHRARRHSRARVGLFNSCDSLSSVSVPTNSAGFQQPATGDGYAGFYAYSYVSPGSNEFLGGELLSPLVSGRKYYISFKVSLSDSQVDLMCGVDKIGILFTNVNWGDTVMLPPPFLSNYAHVYTDAIISDTLSWVTIQGSFIADSNYRYFMIGHFFDLPHVAFDCLDSSNINTRYSYYFVDDVCVSTDSLECNLNSSVNAGSFAQIPAPIIYPNPTRDKIFFKSNFDTPIICNLSTMTGYPIKSIQLHKMDEIDVSDIPSGMYILEINYENQRHFFKQIIIH